MSENQLLLHRAEEVGQARALTNEEAMTWVKLAGVVGTFWGMPLGVMVTTAILLVKEESILSPWLGLGAVAGWLVTSGAVLMNGMAPNLFDRLASWREAETYAPVMPEPQPRWRPPVPVVRKGEVQALLDMNEKPGLPEPEPMLTPQRVLEILQASVENDGSFSRRTITNVKLSDGLKVTRGMWREMSAWLHKAGILRQDGRGSYCLPHQVRSLDDLLIQLPGLAQLGGPDGQRTGLDTGGDQSDRSESGEVGTLADRRKQQWLECGCDVELYKGGAK